MERHSRHGLYDAEVQKILKSCEPYFLSKDGLPESRSAEELRQRCKEWLSNGIGREMLHARAARLGMYKCLWTTIRNLKNGEEKLVRSGLEVLQRVVLNLLLTSYERSRTELRIIDLCSAPVVYYVGKINGYEEVFTRMGFYGTGMELLMPQQRAEDRQHLGSCYLELVLTEELFADLLRTASNVEENSARALFECLRTWDGQQPPTRTFDRQLSAGRRLSDHTMAPSLESRGLTSSDGVGSSASPGTHRHRDASQYASRDHTHSNAHADHRDQQRHLTTDGDHVGYHGRGNGYNDNRAAPVSTTHTGYPPAAAASPQTTRSVSNTQQGSRPYGHMDPSLNNTCVAAHNLGPDPRTFVTGGMALDASRLPNPAPPENELSADPDGSYVYQPSGSGDDAHTLLSQAPMPGPQQSSALQTSPHVDRSAPSANIHRGHDEMQTTGRTTAPQPSPTQYEEQSYRGSVRSLLLQSSDSSGVGSSQHISHPPGHLLPSTNPHCGGMQYQSQLSGGSYHGDATQDCQTDMLNEDADLYGSGCPSIQDEKLPDSDSISQVANSYHKPNLRVAQPLSVYGGMASSTTSYRQPHSHPESAATGNPPNGQSPTAAPRYITTDQASNHHQGAPTYAADSRSQDCERDGRMT